MLTAGDQVPHVELPDQHGTPVRLAELIAEGPVVVFFYPRAMTPGCTKESCHFRDLAAEFAEVGATRVGISADPVERQAAFDQRNDLGYPLLSDVDGVAASAFGVARPGPLWNRRATFVIDGDGTVLEAMRSEMNMDLHADRALEVLRSTRAVD